MISGTKNQNINNKLLLLYFSFLIMSYLSSSLFEFIIYYSQLLEAAVNSVVFKPKIYSKLKMVLGKVWKVYDETLTKMDKLRYL